MKAVASAKNKSNPVNKTPFGSLPPRAVKDEINQKRHLFGIVDAMDVTEFNDIAFCGLELSLLRSNFHETRILEKNG